MEDPVFQVVITPYLKQLCPLMGIASVLGRLFGKNGTKLETYGVKFAVVALPGQGHSTLLNQLQSALQAIMKLGCWGRLAMVQQLCDQSSGDSRV